ncbi:intraflagellar transport protein 52 homolog isoform X2 [Hetaerina americana]|uniref:intraflagellar transport protein 52 homolog isoform X2 n=1 Tax=Hetaerina americana TaxID=62018 RepID=UPI003A7F3399
MAPVVDMPEDLRDKMMAIVFNSSKNEVLKMNDGYKILQRKLKGNWKVLTNKEDVTAEVLAGCSIFVLPGPREKFTENEFNCIKQYLDSGGNLLVLLGEGGEKAFQTNINFLLEEYGIMINSDSVIRTHYYKYFHPKECLVLNGVLNKGIENLAAKLNHTSISNEGSYKKSPLPFIYPFGATLNVARPAIAALSSGSAAYPANRPVCALYKPQDSRSGDVKKTKGGGRIVVLGSLYALADMYLEKEANRILLDIILKFLSGDPALELNKVDAEDPEVFPPSFRELRNPQLELFDLDDAFSSESSRLAQLANKCIVGDQEDENDIEYFIRECGNVLHITSQMEGGNVRDARHILYHVAQHISEFKKLNAS